MVKSNGHVTNAASFNLYGLKKITNLEVNIMSPNKINYYVFSNHFLPFFFFNNSIIIEIKWIMNEMLNDIIPCISLHP